MHNIIVKSAADRKHKNGQQQQQRKKSPSEKITIKLAGPVCVLWVGERYLRACCERALLPLTSWDRALDKKVFFIRILCDFARHFRTQAKSGNLVVDGRRRTDPCRAELQKKKRKKNTDEETKNIKQHQ